MSSPDAVKRDVFVCHAGEDKDAVVRPFVRACERLGIRCWLDETHIGWGESIPAKINEGLGASTYAVVVMSKSSVAKPYQQRELNTLLNEEASSGKLKVLPLYVGDAADRKAIQKAFPLLSDKKYLVWDGNPDALANQVASLLEKVSSSASATNSDSDAEDGYEYPMPEIAAQFTDRDREKFLKSAFTEIQNYFQGAALQLAKQAGLDCELEPDGSRVFRCRAFKHGNLTTSCKVWLYDSFGSLSIAFVHGPSYAMSGNSYNEMLIAELDGRSPILKGSLGVVGKAATPRNAAESLWKEFCKWIR